MARLLRRLPRALVPHTLVGRIVSTTVAVAVAATVVSGVVSFGLVRVEALSEARSQASATADRLAALSGAELDRRAAAASASPDDVKVAVIEPDGAVEGSIGIVLRPRVRALLARGTSQSTTISSAGRRYIVEARQTADGGTVVVARSVRSVDAAMSRVTDQLLIALGLGLVVAIVAGVLLARVVARPLRRTATAARRLARGERGIDVPRTGTVEVQEVANALDDLDDALTVSESRQREFLLSISHELRTPLTALRGYAEALADGVVPENDTRRVGDTMLAETQRLDRFVADLLELARLEAQDFPTHLEPVDVARVVAEACTAWSAVAEGGGVVLDSDVRPPVMAFSDGHRLRQLLDGLLENALRATPSQGTVRVTAAPSVPDPAAAPRIRLTVADTGPGLTPDDLDVAFARGELRDRYRGSRAVGTGLGLSIAARLAARLGARLIAVDTTGTPWGGCFRLDLPTTPEDATAAVAARGAAGAT